MIGRHAAAPMLLLAAAGLVSASCHGSSACQPAPAGSVGVGVDPEVLRLLEAGRVAELALLLPPLEAGRPARVALVRRSRASPPQLAAVLRDVESYPRTVPQVESVTVRERAADSMTFDLELELPFNNLDYGLKYDFGPMHRIDVSGLTGPATGGRWTWEFVPCSTGTIVVYTSENELGDQAGLMLRQILDIHPDLEQGLAFAQGLRFLRSICVAAEQR